MPKATALRQMASDKATYTIASMVCPERSISTISNENVLKVVNPPQNPVTNSMANCGFSCFEIQTVTRPITMHPKKLAIKVWMGMPPSTTA